MSDSTVRRIGDAIMRNATVGLIHPADPDGIIPDWISCSPHFSKVYCWYFLLTLIMSWKENIVPTLWLYVMSALWHRQQVFHKHLPWLEAVESLNIRKEQQMRGGSIKFWCRSDLMGISRNFNSTVECRWKFEASVVWFADRGLRRLEIE